MFKLFIIITAPTVILISQAGYSLLSISSLVLFYIICFYIYERSYDNEEIVVKEKNLSKPIKLNQKSILTKSSFFKNNKEPLMILDSSFNVLSSNKSFHDFLGSSPNGKNISLVLRSAEFDNAIEKLNITNNYISVDLTVFSVVQKHLTAQLFYINDPDDPSILVMLMDKTNQYIAERLKTDFVSNVSHELRTPLASILGFLETIEGPAKDDEEKKKEFYQIIRSEAERMQRLVNDLLSLTRVEESEFQAPSDKVDLLQCLDAAVDVVEVIAKKKKITINSEFDKNDKLIVRGNHDQLLEVFENLLDNAVTYTDDGKVVSVSVKQDTNYQVVEITDEGVGISEQDLVRVTERFFRCTSSLDYKRHSSGLGLSIVKHILNRHEGKLEVTSELGKGSTFKAYIPTYS